MSDCELLPRCPFFNNYMEDMPATTEVLKETYCRGNHRRCARYIVQQVTGSEGVPVDLLPTDESRGVELVAGARWGGESTE